MVPPIDMHVHIGPRWDDVKNVKAGYGDLAPANQAAGVSVSVASSAESLLSRTVLGTDDDSTMERRLFHGNEDLLGLCREHSGLRMMVVVDPSLDASLLQARAMLPDPRVVGIKLHPDRHRFGGGDFGTVMELAEEFPGKAVLIHCTATRYSDPRPMIVLARAHPRVPLILAHLGRTDPPDLVIGLIRGHGAENAYVDTSAMRDAAMIGRAIASIGAGRILFGSDFPFYSPQGILALIRSSDAGEADKERILSANSRELLGLP